MNQTVAKTAKIRVELKVNGKQRAVTAYPMERLLDVLREELRLTGTKEGCGEGECGACSVMMDGKLVNSCLVPAIQAQGAVIKTIESAEHDPTGRTVQSAFLACGGAQCGICTPGMVLASMQLLKKHPRPTDEQIREGLAGNICRCTGYMKIFDSVRKAAEGARSGKR